MIPLEKEEARRKLDLLRRFVVVAEFRQGPLDGQFAGFVPFTPAWFFKREPVIDPIIIGSPGRDDKVLVYRHARMRDRDGACRYVFEGWADRPDEPPTGESGFMAL